MPSRLKRVGLLIGGFEYQHHVAALHLLKLLRPGTDAVATTIEADDGGVLDDVRQVRRDRTEYIQVKWGASDTPAPIGVDVLTAAPGRLLAKMCRDWATLRGPRRIVLWSNRPISPDLAALSDGPRLRGVDELNEGQLRIWESLRKASGLDAQRFAAFASDVELRLGGPTLDQLVSEIDHQLRDVGIASEDVTDLRNTLLSVVRDAAMQRREPFLRADLVSALALGPQQELPEKLSPPEFGYVDRPDETTSLWDRVREQRAGGVVAVVGLPGVGKSAFMAQAIAHPPPDVAVIAEHFAFLPRSTRGAERVEEHAVLETLLAQIARRFGSDEVRVGADALNRELARIGADLETRGQIGVLVLDALDELVDFRDEGILLFDRLVPENPPANVVFVLSAQSERQFNQRLRMANRPNLEVGALAPPGARALVLATGVQDRRAAAGLRALTDEEIDETTRRAGRIPLLLILLGRRLASAEDVAATLDEEPVVEDGDVGRTFGALWTRCSATARFMLAALCVGDEPLSASELAEVAGVALGEVADALSMISHALARGSQGLSPYHRYFARYVNTRGDEAIALAAGATAALFGRLPDDSRSIRSRWALLRRAGDDLSVARECSDEIIDHWLSIGVPTSDIERNLTLAYDVVRPTFPADPFGRVALLRGTLAQRLQDMPMDDYVVGLHAAHGIAALRRHLTAGGAAQGDRRAAAAASLIFARAGHHDEATALAHYALREYEPMETLSSDDFPDAVEALARRGVRDLAGAVRWATGSHFFGRQRLAEAIARGARAGGTEDALTAAADALEPGPRRTMRRAIVVAALEDPGHAAALAAGWREDLIPNDLSDQQRFPEDGFGLALAPLLVLDLTTEERRQITAASRVARRFLELQQLATQVRRGGRSLRDLVAAMATSNVPPHLFANDAFVELLGWTARGRRLTGAESGELAAATLAVSPALLGPLNVVEALRVARFDDPAGFARPIVAALGGADEAPNRVALFCQFARFLAEQGATAEARDFFFAAISASRLFGSHKDISFEVLIDSLKRAYTRLPVLRGDVEHWAEQLLPCAELLPRLTDMDEHRGTHDDLAELRNLAREGRVPVVTDFGSDGERSPLDRDWRQALGDLYAANLDDRGRIQGMLLQYVATSTPAALTELAEAIIAQRNDGLDGTSGDRLLGAVVRREITLDVEGWRAHAYVLVRAGNMHFRFWTHAFHPAMDALIELGRRGDARFDELRREVYMTERAQNPWAAWDIVPQQGEIAAGLGDAASARDVFDPAVAAMWRRFVPFVGS